MSIANTADGYGWVAKLLHWLVFICLLMAVFAGYNLEAMEAGPEKDAEAGTHASFGLLILFMVILRLGWRLINVQPELEELAAARRRLANRVHQLLYLLMFLQPLSGVGMVQAYGYPLTFFGMFSVPAIMPQSENLGVAFYLIHSFVWVALTLIVVGHALVALHHHFIKKNRVLRRMSFG